ncbi:MAG TPA: PIG-L deacetylase family protein [Acidimicrobiales bacterium]|nr:PIG-L deacetylase family protein [Acidimicrobiales bacterium]
MTLPAAATPRTWSPETEVFGRALVVCAHPDDVDFGCAATVATFVDLGTEVRYCIVTNGEAGGSDRSQTRDEMAGIRQDEQRAAAAAVGVHDVTFLGYPDGRLGSSIELRRDVSRVIREFGPDLVITQSPERNLGFIYASHPDHLAAGEATVDAVYPDARNPFAHPELLEEGLEPHTVPYLWLMAAPNSNLAVDTTDHFARKVAALACHKSQGGDDPGMEKRLSEWGRGNAATAGLADGRLAELFLSIPTG